MQSRGSDTSDISKLLERMWALKSFSSPCEGPNRNAPAGVAKTPVPRDSKVAAQGGCKAGGFEGLDCLSNRGGGIEGAIRCARHEAGPQWAWEVAIVQDVFVKQLGLSLLTTSARMRETWGVPLVWQLGSSER
eukprot:3702443-Pyramimonas_sp.AAC.1